uniref:GTD-binding domain-containing protein n=1 Tax=Leersia perrieri TaxID=77586 RepID=A0A0D9XZE5_9ORYZ
MADSGEPPPPLCPLCGHPTSSASSSPSIRPPLKRKAPPAVVRVEIGDEAAALREALARQQAALGDLQAELDAERGAAAGAASEAMTMILRLQREKAEAMMEARQFRRYAEEKMSHDAAELASLEDLLANRDAAAANPIQPVNSVPNASTPHPHPSMAAAASYPALRCFIDHPPTASEADALDAAHRVNPMASAAAATTTTPIIRVAPGSTFPRPSRAYSDDYYDDGSIDFCDGDYFPDDDGGGGGDYCDRVYTVDAIHGRPPLAVPEGSSGYTPAGGSSCCGGGGGGAAWAAEDEEMRRLSARLQVLEAERETMRQAIVSMGSDKAQAVLLKEIAQQLCGKEAAPPPRPLPAAVHLYKGGGAAPAVTVKVRPPMHRRVMEMEPIARPSFIAAVVKWVASITSRQRKITRIKYPIGQCGNNVGLLLLLDKAPRAGHGHQKMPKKI